MLRVVMCIAACALPFGFSSSAGAQSYVSLSGEAAIASPGQLGPPTSIMRHYMPHAASPARALGLLIDGAAPVAPPAPIAGISVMAPQPIAHNAAHDLGTGHSANVVAHVKGAGRE